MSLEMTLLAPAGTTVPLLGNEALAWDVWGGLWALDGDGLVRLDPDGGAPERVATLPTAMAGLGPATPVKDRFARDLDHDGEPELLVHSGGRYHAFAVDGTALGSIPAPATGALESGDDQGGSALQVTRQSPSFAVADVDGDGLDDLVLPRGRTLWVGFTGPEAIAVRQATLELPVDLDPREDRQRRKDQERRRITSVWLQDLDGDGRMDLGLHQMVIAGSWFGTTAELVFARGTGTGFLDPQIVRCDTASFFARALDADGDGDVDLLIPQMDTGLTALARALVSKALPVDLDLFQLDGGHYQGAPTTLMEVSQQVEGSDGPWWVYADTSDVDGDGLPDLVRHEGQDTLEVYLGGGRFDEGRPAWSMELAMPEHGDLLVHDVTGDGRAEVLLWGPRAPSGTLLLPQ